MRRLLTPALVAFLALPASGAQAFDQGSLVNASGPLGLPGLGQIIPSTAGISVTGSQGNVVTADGRYVVFTSDSDALLTPEQAVTVPNGIFLRDLQAGTTELVSLKPDGQPIVDPSVGSPSISADGDRIAFITDAALVPSDGNGGGDLYVRDRSSAITFLASSKQGDDTTGTGNVEDAAISGNGSYVVYRSSASDLVSGDTNDSADAFRGCIAQLCLGDTTLRVSVDSSEAQLDAGSFVARPSISSDGTKIAFETNHEDADGADPGPDNDNNADIYLRDVTAGTTELVSRADGAAGAKASTDGLFARISAEGDNVAFTSTARDLEGAESLGDDDRDVFVRHLLSDQTSRITLTDDESQMSGDASVALPQTVAGDLIVAFTHDGAVYLRNVSLGTLDGPLFGTGGSSLDGLADDTETIVASSSDPDLSPDDDDDFANVYARPTLAQGPRLVSRPTGTAALPRGPGRSSLDIGRQLSADGRYVAFKSEADALLPGELRSRNDQVVVRDLITGDVTLVSRAGAGGAPGNADSEAPQISADGRRVLFQTRATNLVEGLTGQQVLLRDLDTGTTTLVSAGPGGAAAEGIGASRPALSSDGQVAAYTSASDNLGLGALATTQVIVRDLRTGVQQLGSATTAGTPGDDVSDLPTLDGDGSRVAFTTYADNIDGDPDADTGIVIVKDLVDASVRVASLDASGAKLPTGGFQPSLDDAGTRVAFGAQNKLDPLDGVPDGLGVDVAVRDLSTATTTRVSRRADGGEPNAPSSVGTLSRDGRYVVFTSSATDLAADALTPADAIGVYLADLQTGAVQLAGRRADGTVVAAGGTSPDVSTGGRCVALESSARNVFADSAGFYDFGNVLVKAATGACPLVAASGATPTPTPTPTPIALPGDSTKPTISALTMTNKRFRRSSRATAVSSATKRRAAAKLGTAFRFRLSEAATVRIVLERKESGRRVGKVCRKATANLRKRRACTRYVVKGTLTRKLAAGSRSVAFSGRVGRKAVPLGAYRARLVATDAARNRSAERRIAFTIVRR